MSCRSPQKWLEMVVKRPFVSLLIFGTPSITKIYKVIFIYHFMIAYFAVAGRKHIWISKSNMYKQVVGTEQ